MTQSISTYLVLGLIAAFWGFVILGSLIGGSVRAQVRRAKAEGRYRLVNIDGKQYHAIRTTETIVRSKAGKAHAVLVSWSRDRDPHMVDGKMVMINRRIKVRALTGKGLSERERWVPSTDWEVEGEQDIEYHIPVK